MMHYFIHNHNTFGTKLSARAGNGVGYKYRGNFLYAVDASGNETLESIGCDEGRIVVTYSSTGVPSYKDYWQVKDHLGSVRAVYDLSTTGTIDSKKKELSDYQPYGNRIARTSTSYNHWRFSGKEEQKIDGTDIGLLYFGARYYDPWLARWTTQDPLAHKYAGINPYVYCNGDPVNLLDVDGLWSWGHNGNLFWENGDNAFTLADYLQIGYLDAISILERNSNGKTYEFSDGFYISSDYLWVEPHSRNNATINNTFEAVLHYYFGKGHAVNIGDKTTEEAIALINKKHPDILTERYIVGGIDMTGKTFHVGRTSYSVRFKRLKNSVAITYNLFIRDSFSDPNFIAEGMNRKSQIYQPDHLGPNLELWGTPYNYRTRTRTYFKPTIFPRLY